MTKIVVEYQGDLRCLAHHTPSGSQIETDAPPDNAGLGHRFSPTDLFATSLGTCIATVLGIFAKNKSWDLRGLRVEVQKEMTSEGGRRIAALRTDVWMPVDLSDEDRERVWRVATTCPVHRSLHPDIQAPITIHWPML